LEKISYTLLLVCLNHELAQAQRMILEVHRYDVLVANDLRELDRISKNNRLPCAILGQDLGPDMKHAIAATLSRNLPAIAILEEYSDSPVLPDAEHVLAGDSSALLDAIEDLLLPYGRRHTKHLRSKARALVKQARELVETAQYTISQNRQARADAKRARETGVKKKRA